MPDVRTVHSLVRALWDEGDGELQKSRDLVLALLDHTGAPFSRNQFAPGHITCAGMVFSPDRRQILLVHHNRLDRWLLPGGHVEPKDGDIWETARREVVEETAARLAPPSERNQNVHSDSETVIRLAGPALIGVDVHGIPPGKGEPYHLHHDLVFAFQALSLEVEVSAESRALAWARPDEFNRYAVPANVRRAVIRWIA